MLASPYIGMSKMLQTLLAPFKIFSLSEKSMSLPSLADRLRAILPEQYQECFEELEPVSMGTASLKYDESGNVAWDQIWGSFCNLAMAGGPPHKGTLLEPGAADAVQADAKRYREVVNEACRGIRLVTDLAVDETDSPGWIQLFCHTQTMAEWMVRAIVVENVSARQVGSSVMLPVGPSYRIAKEVKNIVTVVAKTWHYWMFHMSRSQQRAIGNLFLRLNVEFPLLEPTFPGLDYRPAVHDEVSKKIATLVFSATGLDRADPSYPGWLGLRCASVNSGVWMMRALVASNVLARREDLTLFVPVDPLRDAEGIRLAGRLETVHQLAKGRGVQ